MIIANSSSSYPQNYRHNQYLDLSFLNFQAAYFSIVNFDNAFLYQNIFILQTVTEN